MNLAIEILLWMLIVAIGIPLTILIIGIIIGGIKGIINIMKDKENV